MTLEKEMLYKFYYNNFKRFLLECVKTELVRK